MKKYRILIPDILPVVGVLWLGWSVFDVLIAYWIENIVIGIYTVLRIGKAQPGGRVRVLGADVSTDSAGVILKLFLIPFFIVHFGGFALGHGVALVILFGPSGILVASPFGLGFLGLGIMFLSYVITHGISYKRDYVGANSFRNAFPGFGMFEPYRRVVVIHLIIMLGAFIPTLLDTPEVVISTIIVVLKVVFDYFIVRRAVQ